MKLVFIIVSGFLCSLVSQELSLEITGYLPLKGDVHIELYRDAAGFGTGERAERRAVVAAEKLTEGTISGSFSNLKTGETYAVIVFQDLNDNGVLDVDFRSIAQEPAAFSQSKNTPKMQSYLESCFIMRPGKTVELHLLHRE
ncbi:MAG: DUF2141 domain-containing protein [Fibrobacterota bacterium]